MPAGLVLWPGQGFFPYEGELIRQACRIITLGKTVTLPPPNQMRFVFVEMYTFQGMRGNSLHGGVQSRCDSKSGKTKSRRRSKRPAVSIHPGVNEIHGCEGLSGRY
jgi:hypothetical protein